MSGKLVIISAPSGAGKTTIVNHLLEKGTNLRFSVSATTRNPRGNEENGKEYFFLTVGDFKAKIKNGEFIEWQEVYKDQFYGTLKSEIEKTWAEKKHVIFDVDVQGGINLKNIYGKRAISIFLMPPSVKELENRLLGRATDDSSRIRIRIDKAMEEIKLAAKFDYTVINDNLDLTKREVFNLVKSFIDE